MTGTITIVAGLALLIGVVIGSLASAKMASAQLANRVAMNDASDGPHTDATDGAVTRDRWAAYWNRVSNASELEVVRPARWCATF
jgi:hypothetical protein